MNLRISKKPVKTKICDLCGSIVAHVSIVNVDIDGDGLLTEKDEIWIPRKRHNAPCGNRCAANIELEIPNMSMHGYLGRCKDCGDI